MSQPSLAALEESWESKQQLPRLQQGKHFARLKESKKFCRSAAKLPHATVSAIAAGISKPEMWDPRKGSFMVSSCSNW